MKNYIFEHIGLIAFYFLAVISDMIILGVSVLHISAKQNKSKYIKSIKSIFIPAKTIYICFISIILVFFPVQYTFITSYFHFEIVLFLSLLCLQIISIQAIDEESISNKNIYSVLLALSSFCIVSLTNYFNVYLIYYFSGNFYTNYYFLLLFFIENLIVLYSISICLGYSWSQLFASIEEKAISDKVNKSVYLLMISFFLSISTPPVLFIWNNSMYFKYYIIYFLIFFDISYFILRHNIEKEYFKLFKSSFYIYLVLSLPFFFLILNNLFKTNTNDLPIYQLNNSQRFINVSIFIFFLPILISLSFVTIKNIFKIKK